MLSCEDLMSLKGVRFSWKLLIQGALWITTTHVFKQIHRHTLSLSHPGDEGVSSLRWGEVQGQDIGCVTVETLQQLSALHIPQGTCAVTAGGQELTHTHTYIYVCSSHIDKKQDKTIYNQQCENMKLHPPEVFWSEGKTWMFCLLLVLLFKNFLVTQMKSIHLIMFFVNKHYTEGTFTLTHWLPWYAKEAYNGKQDPRKCHQRGILTCKFCHLLQRMKLGWLGLIWHRWWS